MSDLSENYLVKQYVAIFKENGFIHIASDTLYTNNQFVTKIRQYNKMKNTRIPTSKHIKEIKSYIKRLKEKENDGLLKEILDLLDLAEIFSKMQISGNEITKRRESLFLEIKIMMDKRTDNNIVIDNDIMYDKGQVEFVKIKSLQQFNSQLDKRYLRDNSIYYRGQSNINWPIKPSIYRQKEWIENEKNFVHQMVINNPSEFLTCTSTLDKLTKMQHYTAPTRLLDLTKNPLVALYFACENEEKDYGEVLFFESRKEDEQYYDSDAISIVSNIAMMDYAFENNGYWLSILKNQIRRENVSFSKKIKLTDLDRCLFTHVKLDNRRIMNQQGLFLLVGIKDKKSQPSNILNYLSKSLGRRIIFRISPTDKPKILSLLDKVRINKAFIYPEIDDVADYLKKVVYAPKK
jgi:hypothetical protein